jgi:hypothetical protein
LLAIGFGSFVNAAIPSQSTNGFPTPTALPILPALENHLDPSQPQATNSIKSPSPTCVNAIPGSGVCYINWDYLSLNVAPSYIITMTLEIDNQPRANVQGFFQGEIYLNNQFFQPGFQVTCGFPKSNSPFALGNTYSYAIRARNSSGVNYLNSGQITCPADIARLYLPSIKR